MIPEAYGTTSARCGLRGCRTTVNVYTVPVPGRSTHSNAVPWHTKQNGSGGSTNVPQFVHRGATSQDIIDTALVLQLRDTFDLLDSGLQATCDAVAKLAAAHRATPMIGRTWLQQALPITLGLKFAQWLDALLRHRERLAALRERVLVLQFGGAAGTLASLRDAAPQVTQALAKELGLAVPTA